MFKKTLLALALVFSFAFAPVAFADTASDLQAQINAILAQIKILQATLNAQTRDTSTAAVSTGGSSSSSSSSGGYFCHNWNTNLRVGSTGDDVSSLTQALQKEGFNVGGEEPRSYSIFYESTASAVSGFQEKYASEILTPNGLKYGTGFVGAATRAKLNQLYGCSANNPGQHVISYLQAPAEDKNIMHAGEKTWIYGSGLGSAQYVMINGQSVPMQNSSDSSVMFYAPSNIQNGTATIYVGDQTLWTSNAITIKTIASAANTTPCPANQTWNGSACASVTQPSISSVSPQQVQVGQSLTVYFSNGGHDGSVILKTLDGSKTWYVPYTTGTVYNGFTYYDGNKITFTVPSTIGRGQLPENSGYEAPIAITSGTYNLFVNAISGPTNNVSQLMSNAFPITINTSSTSQTYTNATDASASASVVNSFDDHAGEWGQFNGGGGIVTTGNSDWNISLSLTLGSAKTIKSISVYHTGSGAPSSTEGWSTASSDDTGRNDFPLVVFQNNTKLNTAYDKTFGPLQAGSYQYVLYGQVETPHWYGGKVVVDFTDGTQTTAPILISPYVPPTTTSTNTNQPSITSLTAVNVSSGMNSQSNQYSYDINWTASIQGAAVIAISCPGSSGSEYITTGSGANSQQVLCTTSASQTVIYSADNASGGSVTISKTTGSALTVSATLSIYAPYSSHSFSPIATKSINVNLVPPGVTARPSITVLSPNGGESYIQGNNINIRWNGGDFGDTVTTPLYTFLSVVDVTKPGYPMFIGSARSSSYNFNWDGKTACTGLGTSGVCQNPYVIPPGNYRILVQSQSLSDQSDSYFTITAPTSTTQPSINSLSPSSGIAGSYLRIAIAGSGFTPDSQVSFAGPVGTSAANTQVSPLSVTSDGKSISVLMPSSLIPGSYNVRVININGTSALSAFTVTDTCPAGQSWNGSSCAATAGTVTNSSLSVSTANTALFSNTITAGSYQTFAAFAVSVQGNPIVVSGLKFHVTNMSTATSGGSANLIGDVSLVDDSGATVAGPVTVGVDGTTNITFATPVTFSAGAHTYVLKGTFSPSFWTTSAYIHVSSSPATDWSSPRDKVMNNAATVSTPNFTTSDVLLQPLAATAPTITSFSGQSGLTVGQTGSWSLSAQFNPSSVSAYQIDWGDGTSNKGNISNSVPVVLSHIYNNAGSFTITATVSANGLSATKTASVAVASGATAASASPVIESAALTSQTSNYAGPWGVFAPGMNGSNPNDWGWTVNLSMNGNTKTVSAITVVAQNGETWSTANAGNWPLVVFKNGAQVNTGYGQTFSAGPATEILNLYAQQASTAWGGGTVSVSFSDNTKITASIAGSAGNAATTNTATSYAPSGMTAGVGNAQGLSDTLKLLNEALKKITSAL